MYCVKYMSKYGVISGTNTGKYGPEITLHLDTFHAGTLHRNLGEIKRKWKSFTLKVTLP